jgi:hypothetical protein
MWVFVLLQFPSYSILKGPVLVVGRLYGLAGQFYRRGREPRRGYGYRRGLANRGEPSRGFIRGRELRRLNGRGRELYGLTGQLGGRGGFG